LDGASLLSLQEALPKWQIEVVNGATADSLARDWNPGAADLLVVRGGEDAAETLGLCRFLVFCGVFSTESRQQAAQNRVRQDQAQRPDAPLLVLVPSGHEKPLMRAALEAGAAGCLIMPFHAGEVTNMLARVRQGELR